MLGVNPPFGGTLSATILRVLDSGGRFVWEVEGWSIRQEAGRTLGRGGVPSVEIVLCSWRCRRVGLVT